MESNSELDPRTLASISHCRSVIWDAVKQRQLSGPWVFSQHQRVGTSVRHTWKSLYSNLGNFQRSFMTSLWLSGIPDTCWTLHFPRWLELSLVIQGLLLLHAGNELRFSILLSWSVERGKVHNESKGLLKGQVLHKKWQQTLTFRLNEVLMFKWYVESK